MDVTKKGMVINLHLPVCESKFLLAESDPSFLYSSLHNYIVRSKTLGKRDFILEDTVTQQPGAYWLWERWLIEKRLESMPCSARNRELCQVRLGSVVSASSLYPDGTKPGTAEGSCTEMSAVSQHTPLLHPDLPRADPTALQGGR